MRTLSIKSASLTASGNNKFKNLENIARMRLAALLENSSEEIKEKVATFSPNPAEEVSIISMPGYSYDIIKHEAGFMYLQEAIITEEIAIKTTHGGDVISAEFGNCRKLNPLIGFGWYHGYRRYEQVTLRRTSDPEAGEAWKHLLEAWELGGSVFTVRARNPDDVLTLGFASDGSPIQVEEVEKQIPGMQPFTMYQSGSYFYYNTLLRRTRDLLKECIAGAGFITA